LWESIIFQFDKIGDESGIEFTFPEWGYKLIDLGKYLASEKENHDFIRHTIISAPSNELIFSFLAIGLISEKIKEQFKPRQINFIGLDELEVGMHIQARSGKLGQIFSGEVEDININESNKGRVILKIQNRLITLNASSITDISIIEYKGNELNSIGFWDPYKLNSTIYNPWEYLQILSSEQFIYFSNPIISINSPIEKMNEELKIKIIKTIEKKMIMFQIEDFLCPVGRGRNLPFFVEINSSKNIFKKENFFNFQILVGCKSIIENFELPQARNIISIIGRDEQSSKKVADMILERFSTSIKIDSLPILNFNPAAFEILRFGIPI
jgi:hypothetical protein